MNFTLNIYFLIQHLRKLFGVYPSEKKMAENLHLLHDTLKEAGLEGKYWIIGGLVLGYVREGGVIAYDRHDVDFGIMSDDYERFCAAFPKLFARGFKKKIRFVNSQGIVAQHSFVRQGIAFEFFLHFRQPDGKNYRFFSFMKEKKLELEREMPVFPLVPIEFLGRKWLIPGDTERYLEMQYGDWKTPKPYFDYTAEGAVPCNKLRRFWDGEYIWR